MTGTPGWGTEVARSPRGHLEFAHRPRHLSELLAETASWGDRTFLVCEGVRMSYAEHADRVRTVADRLRGHGVGPGSRVVVLAANSPEFIVCWWASTLLGGICVLANGWWSRDQVAAATSLVEPTVVIADDRRLERVPEGIPTARMSQLLGGSEPGSEPGVETVEPGVEPGVGPASPAIHASSEDDPAVILFTSGTTGVPKGVVLSHRSVIANAHSLLVVSRNLPGRPDLRSGVTLLGTPLFHVSGIQTMLTTALTGGRLVFRSGRFDAAETIGLIEREEVTSLALVTTQLLRLVADPAFSEEAVRTVRSVNAGGMPVPPSVMQEVRARFPNVRTSVGQGYGLTEAGGTLTAAGGRRYLDRLRSSGTPVPVVELRVSEPDGDGVGEILARGPGTMSGYWGMPEDSPDSPVGADGWLRTGDLGRIEDGDLYLTGRLKEVIIRGGENVAAPAVEHCLVSHPLVAEAAVFGMPHADLGEEVCAVVVPSPGPQTAPAELTAQLAAHLAERLAAFEIPSRWWVREAPLPTNDAGKIAKAILVAEWSGGHTDAREPEILIDDDGRGTMTMTNKDAALAWLDALQRGDADAFRDTMTEDVRHEVMGSCQFSGVMNREESCAVVGQLLTFFTDGIRFEIDAVTAEEDRVAVMMHGYSDLHGGDTYNNVYHFLFRIRDGKVSHIYEFADTILVEATIAKMVPASSGA